MRPLVLLLALVLTTAGAAAQQPPSATPHELVVLVHGMGRTSYSMRSLEDALEQQGYEVFNWGYSSYCCSIAELGTQLSAALAARVDSTPPRIHFVGHSLGNIIVRWVLARDHAPWTAGNVVMLGPPNQGSHSADRYSRLFGWVLKPMPELRTDSLSTVRTLPALTNVHIGIIAGEFDGKVTIAETQLAEAAQHRVVPAGHTFLAERLDVQHLVLRFVKTGAFE
jgi:pimeloyl-ACP methyl ester carboxylesterase